MGSKDILKLDSGYSVKNLDIPYTYYDRTGHMPLWNISQMYQNCDRKLASSEYKDILVFPKENYALFVVREKLQFCPAILRNMSLNKNLHYTVKNEYVSSGRSSTVRKISLFIDDDDGINERLLCERYIKMVCINASSKRPMILPDWVKAEDGKGSNPLANKMPIIEPPKNSFSTNFKIGFSDTDYNGHLNIGEYYRILMDCATSASTSGYYHQFSFDMCWYPVREIDASFLGECVVNDVLEIFTWQDNFSLERIYFVFCLKNRNVFQAACIFDTTPYERNIGSVL